MNYNTQLFALSHAIITRGGNVPDIKPARSETISQTARLAVYADGYMERLVGAVRADYPAVEHYMGVEAFENIVREFVRVTPSIQWDLNLYSIPFAAFLCGKAPVYALACLESAIVEIFWLPESVPLVLSELTQEQLAALIFQPRVASRLLALEYTANAYLTALRKGSDVTLEHNPEYVCIIRHKNEVKRLVLEKTEYLLLAELYEGRAFGAALNNVASLPGIDIKGLANALTGYLSRWLNAGIFSQ